ncbi:MAG TPA: molybdopterin-dependent oxidoreductase [Syntrophorhabdaceae bacterium]|nr:molybdopterin-dependent oxidoreductase [Syntrophorhabdaceae bacterium]
MDNIKTVSRRDFIWFVSVFVVSFLMPHSSQGKEMERLLDSEDREGLNVRFIKPFKALDKAKWVLKIDGLCEKPVQLNLAALRKLPRVTQVSRMTCVEGWSGKAKWGGVLPRTLFDAVRPHKEARFLHFYSADDYYEHISLEELLKTRVIFAYEMNDAPLPDIYGGPLRLLMPSKYGYKSVKTIMRLEFVKEDGLGYWSNYGYSRDGTIEPGADHALDLKAYRTITKPGEPDY